MTRREAWLSNKQLFRLHGWLGLNLGLVLFVICFSGTVAVFSYEIDWLIDPAMQAEARAEPVNWQAIAEGVKEEFPRHDVSFIMAPRHEGFAALAYATGPAGRALKMYVNPYTGEVQGRNSFWNVQRFFRSFHRRFFVGGDAGVVLVSVFAFALLLSAVTGILFYRNWHRHLFRLRTKTGRLFFLDFHRLAGVWSLLFAAIIVVTGAWYLLERYAPASQAEVPAISQVDLQKRGPSPKMLNLGEQAALAERAFPGFQARHILPGTPDRATEVRGHADAWLVRPRANRVWVDPVTGKVLGVQKAAEVPAYRRWSDTADPLHFGTFGGWPTQTLWFVFGLLMSSLMLTGGWLWHKKAEKKAQAAGGSRHPAWSYWAATLPVLLLLVSSIHGYRLARSYMGTDTPSAALVQTTNVGPWQADMLRLGDVTAQEDVQLKVYLHSPEGTPNFKHMRLLREAVNGLEMEQGDPQEANPAVFTLPAEATTKGPAQVLRLQVEGWDSATYDVPLSMRKLRSASPLAAPGQGAPAIPVAVWAVIAGFSLLTLGIVGGWLYVAHRTPRTRAVLKAHPPREARAVKADLPTPG